MSATVISDSPPAPRVVLVGAAITALLGTTAVTAVGVLRDVDWARATFDDLLVGLAAVVVLVATPWCLAAALLTCVDALRGRARRRAGVPDAVRRWVLAACGGVVLVAATAPAHAGAAAPIASTGTAAPATSATSATSAVALDSAVLGARAGGWPTGSAGDEPDEVAEVAEPDELADAGLDGLALPDRPWRSAALPASGTGATPPGEAGAVAPDPHAPSGAERRAPDSGPHVVAPGESLWRIAAADLGPEASDAEIAALTLGLYDTHREVVGPDPDLIHPGMEIHLDRAADPSD